VKVITVLEPSNDFLMTNLLVVSLLLFIVFIFIYLLFSLYLYYRLLVVFSL
jgi:hypothetical protein